MTEDQRVLLRLLGQILFCNLPKQPVSAGVVREAEEQAVLPIIAADDIDDIINNMRVYQSHAALHRLLTEHHISYVFLKGYASAYYYPNPTARIAGDVDFLIEKDRLPEVQNLLEQNGYCLADQFDSNVHTAYEKDDIEYELHFNVNGVPEGDARAFVEHYLSDTIITAVQVETPYGPMMIPDNFHHGLIILLHTARHMTMSGLGLRHLCDWAVFVDRQRDFAQLFERPFKEMGIWTFTCQLTALCCKCFPLKPQPWAGEWDESFLNDLLEDILSAGNFGRKREAHNQEKWLISNVDASGVTMSSPLRQLFHNMTQVTQLHWPAAKRFKLLIPIGYIYFSMRYILRMLTGKRKKINIKDMIDTASERRGLYKKFCLFELDKL